jgi:serine/threonine protein phosphatase PrpC
MLRVAEAVARTDTGRQRSGNEDAAYARAPLFVVADGMGGARGGEIAARLAVQAFERGIGERGSAEQRLAARVQEANSLIHERARRERALQGMGTTLTAAYLDDGHLALAHVGDSRAYLFRAGRLERLTQDHSLVSELVRHGKLTEEQAAEHPQRSIITRALGPEPDVEVDTSSHPVQAGDVLLLCSDGLTSMLAEERIAEVLAGTRTLREAAERLIAEANAAGGRDNITVVLFRLEEVGDTATEQPTQAMSAPLDGATREFEVPPAPDEPAPVGAPGSQPPVARGRLALAERPLGPPPARARPARAQARAAPSAAFPRRPVARGRRLLPAARGRSLLPAALATVIVLALLAVGGYLASRELYFVGTDAQGIVTIYRGLPYALPLGIKLYATYYESGVPAVLVPPDRRGALFDHQLRSQRSAQVLVMDLERGQISG